MKRRLLGLLVAALGASAGILAGLFSQQSDAVALESVTWNANPGPSNATANLNCGWHRDCLPPADYTGPALDWANGNNAAVYFRGRGYRTTYNETPLRVGTVYIGQRDGNCYNTVADLVDTNGTYKGRINYTHSYLQVAEGYSFSIYGKFSGNYQSVWVAYSVPNEKVDKPLCDTTGAHLHQEHNYGLWNKGTAFPVDDCSCSKGSQGDITGASKWMYYLGWDA